MNFILTFNDSAIEEKFTLSKLPYHTQGLYFVSAVLFLQIGELFYLVLTNMKLGEALKGLPLIIAMPVALTFLLLLSIKFKQLAAKAIAVAILFTIIATSEFLCQYPLEMQYLYRMFLLFGVNIEVLVIFLLLTKISWVQTVVTMVIASTYSWLRTPEVAIPDTAVIFFCIQIILLSIFSYLIEKEDRKKFLGLERTKEQLKNVEDIMNYA